MSKFESKSSIEQQADAWLAVCDVLDQVAPGWTHGPENGMQCAVNAILVMGRKAAELDKYGTAAYC